MRHFTFDETKIKSSRKEAYYSIEASTITESVRRRLLKNPQINDDETTDEEVNEPEHLPYARNSFPSGKGLVRSPLHLQRWEKGHSKVCSYGDGSMDCCPDESVNYMINDLNELSQSFGKDDAAIGPIWMKHPSKKLQISSSPREQIQRSPLPYARDSYPLTENLTRRPLYPISYMIKNIGNQCRMKMLMLLRLYWPYFAVAIVLLAFLYILLSLDSNSQSFFGNMTIVSRKENDKVMIDDGTYDALEVGLSYT